VQQSVIFKLATYNVHNLGRGDNQAAGVYESKLAFLTDVLRRVDADVVVIDEVREPESFDELADRLESYGRRHLADAPENTRQIQTGILSRLPVLETGQWSEYPVAAPGQPGEVAVWRFRRPMPWLRVELPNGEDLFLVAVHFKSRRADIEALPETEPPRRKQLLGRALAASTRMLESAGLRCLLDDAVARRAAAHYAVLGDFNAPPGSMAVGLVTGVEDEDGSATAESEARRLFQISSRLPPEQAFSYLSRGRRQLFDHILVSQQLSLGVMAVGVESQLLLGGSRYASDRQAGYPRSDHAPVWAAFRLPTAGA
jgi:endonuclease/exonuclease/phosphatase family metal-dependent hydrolase